MGEIRGRYYVIEGTDGAGTTTQAEKLIRDLGRASLVEEPGGTPIGREIRKILKDTQLPRDPTTNLDLFTIARFELVQQVIRPNLDEGVNMVSDRNWFSSWAYQGFGEGLSLDYIYRKSQDNLGAFMWPDFSVIIDIPVEVSEERIKKDGRGPDYFESKGKDFFENVRQGYLNFSETYNIPVIDGTQNIDEVHDDIVDLIQQSHVKQSPTDIIICKHISY
jgi:dTMP kinase